MGRTAIFGPRGWCLNQVASAGWENLDAQHVARYDAIEAASPDREATMVRRLVDRHARGAAGAAAGGAASGRYQAR